MVPPRGANVYVTAGFDAQPAPRHTLAAKNAGIGIPVIGKGFPL
jgi:hypothetical protein